MGNGRSSVVGAFRPFSTVTMNDIRRCVSAGAPPSVHGAHARLLALLLPQVECRVRSGTHRGPHACPLRMLCEARALTRSARIAQRGFDFVLDVASLDALVYEATTRHADASMVEAFGSGPLVNAMEFLWCAAEYKYACIRECQRCAPGIRVAPRAC